MKNTEDVKALGDIIKGCVNNDKNDQEAFFHMFAGRFMAACQRIAPNDHVANDILQDAFIKIFRSMSTLRTHEESGVLAWGKTVITNQAMDFYRKEKRYGHEFNDYNNNANGSGSIKYTEVGGVDDIYDTNTYLESKNITPERINLAIQKLSPSYKLVFNMFIIDGLSHNEIAGVLDISEGTSKSNLSKAKQKLREELTK